jgi:long-chain acyl-CoA synthetase
MKTEKLYQFLEGYVQKHSGKNIFYAKEAGSWVPHTCNDIYNKSIQVAATLLRNNLATGYVADIEAKSKIAIISNNRPEWIVLDHAVQQCGAVLVPIYPTISKNELEYILNDAQVTSIFVSDKKLYNIAAEVKEKLSSIKNIYTFNEVEGATNFSTLCVPYTEQELQKINDIKAAIQYNDLATIIYTSGTTGNPKGVMLSHKNIASNVNNCIDLFTMCDENGKALSFLPMNHIFERMVMYIYIKKGITIYFAQGVETVGENLREIKPDLFTTVPRLLEKVYEKIIDKGSALTGAKRKIFDWALKLAEEYEVEHNFLYSLQHKIADKLVYSKWRDAIGGNVKAIITGSAACQKRLQKLFTCANIVIMEGYGLTETSPVVTVNRYEADGRKFGTIGLPIDNQFVKLGPDGEILCKGDHVMMGYYKQEQLTNDTIIDNWFHTGDIAEVVDGKFLKITDRKKELFKLSAGKYIAPQLLENKMKESPYIEQIMVVGADEKFVGALIVPSAGAVMDYLKGQGKAVSDGEAIISNDDVLKLIRTELNRYNKEFAEHEHVKRFQLLPKEWTIDTGEMTPTLKLKRKVIMEKYKDAVKRIFGGDK